MKNCQVLFELCKNIRHLRDSDLIFADYAWHSYEDVIRGILSYNLSNKIGCSCLYKGDIEITMYLHPVNQFKILVKIWGKDYSYEECEIMLCGDETVKVSLSWRGKEISKKIYEFLNEEFEDLRVEDYFKGYTQ